MCNASAIEHKDLINLANLQRVFSARAARLRSFEQVGEERRRGVYLMHALADKRMQSHVGHCKMLQYNSSDNLKIRVRK